MKLVLEVVDVNIFDYALQMELDGEQYYMRLAEKANHDDLKKVFMDLAKDEQRHHQIIQSVQKDTPEKLQENPLLHTVQNVFILDTDSLIEDKTLVTKLKKEPVDVYLSALEKEKESVELYKKLRDELSGQVEKDLCAKLMQEEEKHMEIIENIIDMFNRVNDWVESAEFNHRETY